MPGTDTCCGFGGLFSVKFPDISNAMVSAQDEERAAAGPDAAAVGRARLPDERRRQAVAAGFASRLPPCGRGARRRDGRAAASRSRGIARRVVKRGASLRSRRRRGARQPSLQAALADVPAGFVAGARAGQGGAARVRGPAAHRSRHSRSHPGAPRPLPRGLRAQRRRAGSQRALGGDRRRRLRHHPGHLPRGGRARSSPRASRWSPRRSACGRACEEAALEVVETDLGEYIIQIRGETPSHIIAPAIHLRAGDVADDFRRRAWSPRRRARSVGARGAGRRGPRRAAREVPRRRGRHHRRQLSRRRDRLGHRRHQRGQRRPDACRCPRCTSCWRRSTRWCRRSSDAWPLLRLLARSATGQEFTAYTTLVTGPRRPGDIDGPEACHVVIVDNGRSELLGSKLRPILRCIRCGACMNHCPVYCAIGGHAYGSVYPGPIGAVLTPALAGLPEAGHLAQASTFCGRCEEVCPVEIPLVSLMRHWREMAIDEPGSRAQPHAAAGLGVARRASTRLSPVAGLAARTLGVARTHARRLAPLPFGAPLDAASRHAGAAGANLSGPLQAAGARGGTMSREKLLGSVRRGLDAYSSGAARRQGAEARLTEAAPHARPAGAGGDLVQHFKDRQRLLGVEVIDVDSVDDVPAAIAAYLRRLGLPARLRCGAATRCGRRCRGSERRPSSWRRAPRRTATRRACRAPLPVSPRRARWPSCRGPPIP